MYGIECYYGVTWTEVEIYCIDTYGTNLASIHSSEENIAAFGAVSSNTSWIGLNDIDNEDTFVWTDGSPFDYDNWGVSAEPNNLGNKLFAFTLGFFSRLTGFSDASFNIVNAALHALDFFFT